MRFLFEVEAKESGFYNTQICVGVFLHSGNVNVPVVQHCVDLEAEA